MVGLRKRIRMGGAIGLSAALWLAIGAAQPARAEWTIPEEERQVPNPVERTAASIANGKKLFEENCASCHGLTGLGDGSGARVLEVKLPNFQDAAWAATRTDGEWFYKISVGKDPMMGSEDFLEEKEIWDLVNYVRSLSAGKDAAMAAAAPATPEVAAPAKTAAAATAVTSEPEMSPEPGATEVAEAGTMAGGSPGEEPLSGHQPDEAAASHNEPAGEARAGEDAAAEAHAEDHGSAAPAEFNPKGITNYQPMQSKGPLIATLLLSVIMGGIFVMFKKTVPPPPGSEAPAGGGHGDDHGHGH